MKPYSGRLQLRYYAMEVLCRPVVADSDHLYENLDPHQKERRGIRIRIKTMRIRIPQAASKTFRKSKQTTIHLCQHNTLPTLFTKPRCVYGI
jgi:hypothetical protein